MSPPRKQKIYENTIWKRVHHDIRVKKTRWVVSAVAHILHGPNGRDEHRCV